MKDTETEVKRFVAPSMSRALELVRDEMGPEAIILSSQKVSGGVEIVTSIERDLTTRGVDERRNFGQNFDAELDHAMESDVSWQSQAGIEQAAANYRSTLERNGPDESEPKRAGEDLAAEIERARDRMMQAKRRAAEGEPIIEPTSSHRAPKPQPTARASAPSNSDAERANERKLEGLQGEIADLRMMLEQRIWQTASAPLASHSAQHPAHEPEPLRKTDCIVSEHLSRLGLAEPLKLALENEIDGNLRMSEAWKQGLAKLARKIPIAPEMNTNAGGVFAFIGPTGVGKTTTLAKLASQYAIEHGPGKVALVSMDTHRVGAVEQMRALGRILDAPVRTVAASSSLMTTLAELKKFPLVLIDTAGFRHGDALLHAQLAQLDQNPSVKRLLVLSSLSQLQTLKASIHAYRPRPNVDACVLSKLDEASSLGEAISAVIHHRLQVAYLTDGQQIPDDVHAATAHRLVSGAVALAKQNPNEAAISV